MVFQPMIYLFENQLLTAADLAFAKAARSLQVKSQPVLT
jgi:hypothetical protein